MRVFKCGIEMLINRIWSRNFSPCYSYLILFSFLISLQYNNIWAQDLVVTENVILEDTTIVLDGNLIIEDGGGLTLNSATIQMNCQYDGQYKIRVEESGSFLRLNNSEIKALNKDYHYSFVCRGQEFEMKNSKISGVGWGDFEEVQNAGDGTKGPVIGSNSAVIDSSEFFDNHVGVILAGDSASVTNSTIHSVSAHGIYLYSANNALLKDNRVELARAHSMIELVRGNGNFIINNVLTSQVTGDATHGVRVNSSHGNLIEGNTIANAGIGVLMMGVCNENIVSNNRFQSGEIAVQVWGWNNKIDNNTMMPYHQWSGDPVYMIYAYNTEVTNNRIIDMAGGSGIWLRHSSNNLLKGNEIDAVPPAEEDNNTRGIFLTESSSHNILHSNQISGSVKGILVSYSSNDNKIYNNELSDIILQGFLIDNADNNIIYTNNRLTNVGRPSFDDGDNTWNYSGAEPALTLASKPVFNNIYSKLISGHEVIENQTINFHYAALAEGASLIIRNSTLITGVDSTDISYIDLQPNSSLEVYDSKILHHEYGSGFTMDAGGGAASYILKDSEIRGAGHEWWYKGIFVMADNVEIENCTFYEASIIFNGGHGGRFVGNKVYNTYTSILFQEPSNITITDNIIDGSMSTAIYGHSQNITIKNNEISNVWNGAGIYTDGIENCLVENNLVYNIYDSYAGIHAAWEGNRIEGNQIYNAYIGMINRSESTEIRNNQISQCHIGFLPMNKNPSISNISITDCDVGLHLDWSGNEYSGFVITDCDTGLFVPESAYNNIFYGNDFINNKSQVIMTTSVNQFDFNGLGNFWSDYNGKDENSDGIGDMPYHVNHETWDNFPSMSPTNISIEPIFLNVYSENIVSTSFLAGDTNVVIAKLTMNVVQEDSGKTANLLGINIDRYGSGQDGDISTIKIWKDYDNDESFSVNSDSLIGQGVLNEGKAILSFPNAELITFAPSNYFISIDISSTISGIGNTIGFSCQDSSYFVAKFPAKVKNTNFPLVFNEQVLPVEQGSFLPLTFSMEQNYPNPFNPETTISYQIAKATEVTLEIYNLLGQKVVTLVDERQVPGLHAVSWNGRDLLGRAVASGVYIYRIKAAEFVDAKKLVLIR